jgi:transposase
VWTSIRPLLHQAADDEDATAVLDTFHVVKLGTQAVDEVRRQDIGTCQEDGGKAGEPLVRCGICRSLPINWP